MSSLFNVLGIAHRSLQANQYALEITQKNISNVNTPGYSRQRVNFTPGNALLLESFLANGGVDSVSIETFRSRFLDYRISRELQSQGQHEAVASALQQVEAVLNGASGPGLQKALSDFFNSFSALANAPEDPILRHQVLARAGDLAREIRRTYDGIQGVQVFHDRLVSDAVRDINTITESISHLNRRIAQARGLGATSEESALRDERQVLVDRLAGLIDITYFETESGAYTIVTRDGALLAMEDQNIALQTAPSQTGGMMQVLLEGVNITSRIRSGKLGGLLEVRDTTIPTYLGMLDDLAASLINRVNAQHAQGADLAGNPGGDFFVPFVPSIPGSNAGAARAMGVAITDYRLIAAADAAGGPGSNANARLLAGIQDELLLLSGTMTAHQFVGRLVFQAGNDMRAAEDGLRTQGQVLLQLENQRDALIGVSMDEEGINLIRYQKAYEASARMIRIVDGLTEELMRILG